MGAWASETRHLCLPACPLQPAEPAGDNAALRSLEVSDYQPGFAKYRLLCFLGVIAGYMVGSEVYDWRVQPVPTANS